MKNFFTKYIFNIDLNLSKFNLITLKLFVEIFTYLFNSNVKYL